MNGAVVNSAAAPRDSVVHALYFVTGVGAIVLPWVAFRRTGKTVYQVLGIVNSVLCGIQSLYVAAFFVYSLDSYTGFTNPILFLIAVISWFLFGAVSRGRPNEPGIARTAVKRPET